MNLPAWVGIVVLVISILINLVGFFGLFLVFFPGLTVAWIGQLVWMLFTRFNQSAEPWQRGLTIGIFVVNTLIMLIGSWLDNVFMAGRAREQGAPWWEIGVSILAMIIGGILFTPIGGLALALGVLFLLELKRNANDKQKAWESTKAMALGAGSAAIVRLLLCALMIGLWVITLFW